MELTYVVRSNDGREFGPATLDQLSAWIKEGRVAAQYEIKRSDMSHYAQAFHFEELKSHFATLVQTAPAIYPTQVPTTTANSEIPAEVKSNGSWFYWIAALSLINTIVAFTGGDWRFFFGLGVTQVLDAVATEMGPAGKTIAFGLDLSAAILFVVFGYYACKGKAWAFLTGMILFALDGLVFLLTMSWIGILVHAYVIFRLFRGFQASRSK